MAGAGRAIGVDVGGTNLRVALVEIDGARARIVEQLRRTRDARDPVQLAQGVAECVLEMERQSESLPVGIGIAAMLAGDEGFVANAPNLGWRDVPFGELARSALGRTVRVENDLSAIAWGEYRFGAAHDCDEMICVFVGTGVGGGAVLGGRLYAGASNASMEIGHTKVEPGGRPCDCGLRGCLEAYAGGRQLARQAREQPSEQLLALANGDPSELHGGHLDRAAREGDVRSAEILERAGRYLGRALADAVTLFNPDGLVVGGTVWEGTSLLRDVAVAEYLELANPPARRNAELRETVLADDAGVLGAADLALRGW